MRKFYAGLLSIVIGLFLLQSCSTNKKANSSNGQFITGDILPDAPELAARGEYHVGVRTLNFVNKGQIDILRSRNGNDSQYDRPLKVEVWYPALVPDGQVELATYDDQLGVRNDSTRPLIPFRFQGRALRNAQPELRQSPFPLIIVSHGYPGSRVLLTYLTENLASKGYVVAAIDHTESTHQDAGGFQSVLLNRPKDILFVLNSIAEEGRAGSKSFLAGLVDADNTGLIGYSMGGYGVLNVAGAGYSEKFAGVFTKMTGGSKAIETLTANNALYKTTHDLRIKAVVAFAPWGMQRGVWDSAGLVGLKLPLFLVAGILDDVSGYEGGT